MTLQFQATWSILFIVGLLWPPATATPLLDTAIFATACGFMANIIVALLNAAEKLRQQTDRLRDQM